MPRASAMNRGQLAGDGPVCPIFTFVGPAGAACPGSEAAAEPEAGPDARLEADGAAGAHATPSARRATPSAVERHQCLRITVGPLPRPAARLRRTARTTVG